MPGGECWRHYSSVPEVEEVALEGHRLVLEHPVLLRNHRAALQIRMLKQRPQRPPQEVVAIVAKAGSSRLLACPAGAKSPQPRGGSNRRRHCLAKEATERTPAA